MAEGEADEVGMHEVLSGPQEPFIGMRFDTLASARAHYNAYTIKVGFSIKHNTSKRKAHTKELEKQQFVYNKYHATKTEEELQQERMTATEDISPVHLDDENDEGEEAGPSNKNTSSKFGVGRGDQFCSRTN